MEARDRRENFSSICIPIINMMINTFASPIMEMTVMQGAGISRWNRDMSIKNMYTTKGTLLLSFLTMVMTENLLPLSISNLAMAADPPRHMMQFPMSNMMM